MPRGRKKIAHPHTASRILAAAERIFAQQGLAGARTDEIALAARANKAMLYYYYRDKQHLHRAVLTRLFAELAAVVEKATPPAAAWASPRQRLLAFVSGYFDFLAEHPNYPRLVQRELMGSGGSLRWIVGNYFRPFHARLRSLIEEGIACGDFRKVDPQHTVFTIIAMTVFYFAAAPVLSEILGRNPLQPEAIEGRRRSILDFLARGLFRPEGLRP